MDKHYLTPLFSPRSIILFAGNPAARPPEAAKIDTNTAAPAEPRETPPSASDYPFAATLIEQLHAGGYSGQITALDIHMTGTLADLAQARADLAIIARPPEELAAALEIAGRIKCRAALIVASGIDHALAHQLQTIARRAGVHLLGPNSLGFQRPGLHLNASVAAKLAAPGPLALVCQSGALTASIIDWANRNGVGFSTVVSLGPHSGVDIAQVLDYFASDTSTQSIIVYLEGITHARRFMSSLRGAATAKPVVVLKAGRKPAGSQAALTHSGAITGTDDVFDAALRRAGAVRVHTFVQLFSAAKCLASRYRPVGRRLAIITNGGGPGVLAADWANEIELEVAQISAETRKLLKGELPRHAVLEGLIDLSEEATPEHYRATVQAVARDRGVDGILVIYSPKLGSQAAGYAQALADIDSKLNKPLLTCLMGDATVQEARALLNRGTIPTFRTPEAAVDAFGNIASFYRNQQLLLQTPPPLTTLAKPDIEGARLLIEGILAERRKVMTEMESKALLSAFHIPVTRTILARNATEAMMIATQLGFPVALKIDSPDISHKSDVEGVALNINNATAVRDTWNDMMQAVRRLKPEARINGITIQNMSGKRRGRELYIGLVTNDPFGPVITFGAGGTMIELIADRAAELPPLNQFLARRLTERSRVSETLGNWRGAPPADLAALDNVLLRVSEMACELPQLREMDINPIIVDDQGAMVVDARIVLEHAPPSAQHYSHLAILPYPQQHEQDWPMRGGAQYRIRPIHPDDASMLQDFVRNLSSESRYFRFGSALQELPERMLSRFTLIDYDREMALVAVLKERIANADGSFTEARRMIGVSRYITNPDHSSCEFSLVVADDFKGQGLGSRLMHAIMDFARSKGLSEIEGLVLVNNENMLKLMRGLGFAIKAYPEEPDYRLVSKAL